MSYQYRNIADTKDVYYMLINFVKKSQGCFSGSISSGLITNERLLTEIIPLMYIVSDLVAVQTNCNRQAVLNVFLESYRKGIQYSKQIDCILDNRLDLYGEFVRGKSPRYEWLISDKTEGETNGIVRCCAAFGDILINPYCADNYDNAPILVHGFDVYIDFAEEMLNFHKLTEKLFYDLRVAYEVVPEFQIQFKQNNVQHNLSNIKRKDSDDDQWKKWKPFCWAALILMILIGLIVIMK